MVEQPAELEAVDDPSRAAALLDPLRARILLLAREPTSATELGARLSLPRQRVNYHVRQLARAGLLKRAGRRRRRNMFEQRYVASARGYVLSPELLGATAADWRAVEDTASAAYLLAVSAQMQADLVRASRGGDRAPAFALKSQFRFRSAGERERFLTELKDAVVSVIARLTSPNLTRDGKPAVGEPWRFVLGCYPFTETPSPSGKGTG
jgi:DNA-binding transcriptional ArsR family regulator